MRNLLIDAETSESMENTSEEHIITANVDEEGVRKIAEEEYGLMAPKIKHLDGYDDSNFHLSLPLTKKNNFHETQLLWPHGYMLKMINSRDSKNKKFFKEYVNVLLHLNTVSFPCPCPVPTKDGKYLGYWSDASSSKCSENSETRKHIFVLLTYLPGEILERSKMYSQEIDIYLGFLLNRLHNELMPFANAEGLHRPDFTWALHFAPKVVEKLLHVIVDEDKRSLISNVMNEFNTIVVPNLNSVDRGIIHGDLNLGNILVKNIAPGTKLIDTIAIIDFTDMHSSYLIYDLALTACYISLHDLDNYEDRIAALLYGYEKELSDLEMQLMKVCICTRLCQSITIGMHTLYLNPNNEYVKNGESLKYGWQLLDNLSKISYVEFNKLIRSKMEHLKEQHGKYKKEKMGSKT